MINKAISFAADAHKDQLRKGTNIPYIVHPMEVCAIAARMTTKQEVLVAAVLHDTVEDCKEVSLEDIREIFGEEVAEFVEEESENKSLTWKERKQHTIDSLEKGVKHDMMIIALADKLSNMRSLSRDYAVCGEKVWDRFNMKDKKMQGWYYKSLCKALIGLCDYPEYKEFCRLVTEVFG